jgi:1-acyl-sn-glycerol-3-phosphate acyltransferase
VAKSSASEGREKRARHFDAHPERRLPIKLLKLGDMFLARLYHRVTVLAPPQIPKTGPAILICNHTSGLDPFLLQSPIKRVVVWMMAEEYYNIRPLTPIFKALEAIPVNRSARDTSAMRLALRALHDGRLLGVFPEGRIEKTRALLPFQAGVAQMAMKTGVPVCPALLDGTQHGIESMPRAFLRRQDATVRFGPPLWLSKSMSLEAATTALRDAVAALASGRFA